MKPIQKLAGKAFLEALHCVEYRVPEMGSLRGSSYLLGLALRYGLVGAAAAHYVLLSTGNEEEEQEVLGLAQSWPEMVEEHMRHFVRHRLPFNADPTVPSIVGQLAYQPVGVSLRLFHFCCPLDQTLLAAADQYAVDYRRVLVGNCSLFQRRKIRREFYTMSAKSVGFALHFFERRQAELEELPEIALLGE